MKRNVSNAMMASLGVTEIEKISSITIDTEDASIAKYAGIYISNPTHENVEEFVRKYMLNELSFFPRILDVSIEIIPSAMDNANKDHIAEASGLVKIKLHKKNIELPFTFRDGELLPFDVIQMDGQRVPFSRENLMKLIVNLDREVNKNGGANGQQEGAYLASENPINPSTVSGFMSDVMQIRDSYVNRKSGGMYVTASEEEINLDFLLEKVATVSAMTNEQKEAMAYVLNKKAYDNACSEMEKIAAEAEKSEPTRKDLKELKKMDSVKFVDVKSIEHGKSIIFPEITSSEMTSTTAIVLSNIDKMFGNNVSRIVVAHDGRVKLIESGDSFLCIEAPGASFKLPTTELRALKEHQPFFALKGNDVIGPLMHTHTNKLSKSFEDKEHDTHTITTLSVRPLQDVRDRLTKLDMPSKIRKKAFDSIVLIPDKKFDILSYADARNLIMEIGGFDQKTADMVAPRYRIANDTNNVLCSDPHTKVFKITGEITNYAKTKEDFDSFYKLASTGHDLLEKTASTDGIYIQCVDRKQKLYNLSINYRDTDKRMMNARRQNFNRITEGKLKAILHILKFKGNTVNEIVYKAKNESRCTYPLPVECTSDDIKKAEGGNVINISAQNVHKTVNKLVDPSNLAMNIATGTVSGLAIDAMSGFSATQKGLKAFDFMKKFASTTEAMSCQFEKLAIENESETYLDYAKLMTIGHHLAEKVATILEDTNNVYPDIVPVAKDIIKAVPLFEKIAYDLTYSNDDKININYARNAVSILDDIYKIACAIEKTVDKDVKFM